MSRRNESAWKMLDEELRHWQAAARVATLWWRDDDAFEPRRELERLLDLAAGVGAPVAVAVIPARADAALGAALRGRDRVTVLQHGYDHVNHAGADERRAELGHHRPRARILEELAAGRRRAADLFAERFLPVLVPPWNRISAGLLPGLAPCGFRGLSTFAARSTPRRAHGLVIANCHLDPIHWRHGGGFLGEDAAIGILVQHLRARREGRVDGAEVTGLLTHHGRQDVATWAFLERLLERLAGADAARWLDASEVFAA